MICPKVLILTLFIFGTFAKDTMENMEEQFKALEKELAEAKMETIESNKRFEEIKMKLAALTKVDEREDTEVNQFRVIGKKFVALMKAFEMEVDEDASPSLIIMKNTLKDLEKTVETNAKQIEDLKATLSSTKTLALENKDTCEKVNEQSILIQANTDNLEILNTKVIFNAQKTEEGNAGGYLTFDQVDINIGDGFDGSSGIFKVPVSGIYKMSFSGQFFIEFTSIRVYKNGSYMFDIYDGNEAEKADVNNVSYTWVMRLVKGDALKLYSFNHLHAESYAPLTFTGELIHIEN